jgi:hypothetical protein
MQVEREELVAEMERLGEEETKLKKEIGKYIRFDPERVETMSIR